MIATFGSFSLAVGLFAALASTLLWFRVAQARPAGPARAVGAAGARQASWLVLGGAAGAVGALEYALVTHDFSLRFVAENASLGTPLYYRVTSLWSALDGSLLLWVLVLGGYTVLVARRVPRGAAHLQPWAATIVSAVAVFFFALALFGGHPFDTLNPAPVDGPGPNPLLRSHPAMGVHPPLLYTGYVGLTVPFAYAIAALVVGDAGRAWLAATRGWVLTAWIALTAGIVLGAWWSYAVLGWGGYWAWDPVENASLLPWLTTTALLHSALLQRRRGALPAWNVTLAAASFALVALGTFLTRSGAVASVHAFTQSPLGPALLGFVAAVLVLTVALLAWRADRLGGAPIAGPWSRDLALLLNNLVLVVLAVTVLAGTLLPLAMSGGGQQTVVGPPYYNRVAVPAALVLLVLMAIGPLLGWHEQGRRLLARRAALPAAVAAGSVGVLGLAGVSGVRPLLAFGLGAGVLATAARNLAGWPTGRITRRVAGAHVVHVGVALAAVAIAGSSSFTTAGEQHLQVGQQATVAGTTVRLVKVNRARHADHMGTRAHLQLLHDGRTVGHATPALTFYPGRQMTVADAAISTSWTHDTYITLLDVAQDSRSATLRVAVEPLVGWLWTAGAVMVLGGLLAAVPGRRRRGQPPDRLPRPIPRQQQLAASGSGAHDVASGEAP